MTQQELPRSSPESQGVSSAAILGLLDALAPVRDIHSIMVMRHGNVIAEGWWHPYSPKYVHELYSLTKSFTSTAVGLAVAEGRLSVDDLVTSFFPDDLPATICPNLAKMRVRHLLSMSTGHHEDATGRMTQGAAGDNWARNFLSLDVEHEPGSYFVYNSAASHMLSIIVQKRTGIPLLAYLQPRLFAPLGITPGPWQRDPRGHYMGGWGLSLKTDDIAKFGLLYAQNGCFAGQRILDEKWVKQATSFQVSNAASNSNSDWQQGYCFQFWRCQNNAYRGDGAFGQYCIVMPEQDVVVAITSGVGDMQVVLTALWGKLLPAMKTVALPEDAGALAQLRGALGALRLAPVNGQQCTATAERISGKTFALDENPDGVKSLRLDFAGRICTALVVDGTDGKSMKVSFGDWTIDENSSDSVIASSCAWTADNTWVCKTWMCNSPYSLLRTCKFEGDRVTITQKRNVGFGPTERPTLIGRMQ